GKAIMHKKVGHTATVIAPAGSYTVKIISISI
ncbi:transcription elongation factor GreA, partial [Lactobacillus salivarius]|nr:transcription elongation factor GreA [Ligilactobacillus salivarius]